MTSAGGPAAIRSTARITGAKSSTVALISTLRAIARRQPKHSRSSPLSSRAASRTLAPGMSHFFAYLARMKFIRRWGLMHSAYPENIQEHSLRVAQIAHALAIIKNRLFGGDVDPERTVALALYHDTSEVLTGDLPAPVKEFNPDIKHAYH